MDSNKLAAGFAAFLFSISVKAAIGGPYTPKVIYGRDDRVERYQVIDPQLAKLADSTVALFKAENLDTQGGISSIKANSYGSEYGLCSGEKFREQPTAAFCSGFLVAEDIVVTAGHCIRSQFDCSETRFVFDFALNAPGQIPKAVDSDGVFACKEIIATKLEADLMDYAVIRLDRKVIGREPLKLRRSGKIADRQSIFVMGHPAGLPFKYASGANVRTNTSSVYFRANLDTYGGNSGSAVFNTVTKEVEGILVRGEDDFVQNGTCMASKVCRDDNCRGEDVTRIEHVLAHLPQENSGGIPTSQVFQRDPAIHIPDFNVSGVEDTVEVVGVSAVSSIKVKINIQHTYVGDLKVSLITPNGQEIILHNRTGASADNIVGVYGEALVPSQSLSSQLGRNANGTWKLKVLDLARRDEGRLMSWSLIF